MMEGKVIDSAKLKSDMVYNMPDVPESEDGTISFISEVAKKARIASKAISVLECEQRNALLQAFHDSIQANVEKIKKANDGDLDNADTLILEGSMERSVRDRLKLSEEKYASSLAGIRQLIDMADPLGQCTRHAVLADDLELYKVSCPIGVIAAIFESRPEALIQIACLAIKSGNALILKGGKEALQTNRILFEALQSTVEKMPGVPKDYVQMVEAREHVHILLKQTQDIDLIVARGSKSLVEYCMKNTSIPILGHADGLCSIYVDDAANIDMAVDIIVDSKLNYPTACNTMETLLVHEKVTQELLDKLARHPLCGSLKFRADSKSLSYLPQEFASLAKEKDFETEFLRPEMAVKCVSNVQEAVYHINTHGSRHTDCIVTENHSVAELFMTMVDSAGVFHNCSTRFADGHRYGFGAELGISTSKIHARGPVGLEGLLIYKYRLYGKGHTVSRYTPKITTDLPCLKQYNNLSEIKQRYGCEAGILGAN